MSFDMEFLAHIFARYEPWSANPQFTVLTGDISLDAEWLKTLGKHLSTQTISVPADERELRLASVAAYRAQQAEVRAEAERKCLELEYWIGKLQALPSGDA